jgi:hypothetical protein
MSWIEFAFTPDLVWSALVAGSLTGLVMAFIDV